MGNEQEALDRLDEGPVSDDELLGILQFESDPVKAKREDDLHNLRYWQGQRFGRGDKKTLFGARDIISGLWYRSKLQFMTSEQRQQLKDRELHTIERARGRLGLILAEERQMTFGFEDQVPEKNAKTDALGPEAPNG
jgi:hypothetical protein